MIQQYLSIKERYPDAILFYRMGDFYEMFFEDAETASRVLEITLTSRNKKDESPVPMCGVPHKAAQGYIARLIEKGFKVAVCDQVEDPSTAQGLVRREVVRVVTPGMVLDGEMLDARQNNYLLAYARNEDTVGLAYLDISTGTFRLCQTENPSLVMDEILRVSPREILMAESERGGPRHTGINDAMAERSLTFLDDSVFEPGEGKRRLLAQFHTLSLEGFGCAHLQQGISAAGALLFYVGETQKQAVAHVTGMETYYLDQFLVVDDQSCRNLELLRNLRSAGRRGTLIAVLDRTITAMGGRLLARWLRYPLLDIEGIDLRLDAVAEAKSDIAAIRRVREALKGVYDLERLGSKISMGQGNARDLLALRRSLLNVPEILDVLSGFTSKAYHWKGDSDTLRKTADLIGRSIREDAPPTLLEGGLIREGYDTELDTLIHIGRDGKGWLASLEAREKEVTGIASLKVRFNKVFGYYIEVPKSQVSAVPETYIRKQTLVNAERYITEELKTFEEKVLGAEENRARLEFELFDRVRQSVAVVNAELQELARYLAAVDCFGSLAEVAETQNYCRPRIHSEGIIDIQDGRHPVVEKMIAGERFVPNSVCLDDMEQQVLLITGPNMAGKSTILRQVALTVILAQMGSFVPARSASISITDRIFTRVGALDNLSHGQSTFMVEMQETADILHNATARSLVVLDEIGRGTSTYDGLSIAWAVAEYLHDLRGTGVKTLFATHYHELTALERTRERVKNLNIAVKEWNEEIIFLRKLVEGATNRSYGIQVARLAGIPRPVIERAKKILFDVENREGEHAPVPDAGGRHPRQLTLFRSPGDAVLEALEKVETAALTPLEALNLLDHLVKRLRSGSD